MLRTTVCAVALALAGCMVTANQDRFLEKYADPEPELRAVGVCHDYGCKRSSVVDLRQAWPRLTAPLAEPAPDAAAERAAIAEAVAAIETEVGALTGTGGDVGGTFAGFAQEGQLDCIDEATNTTTYLTLMEDQGLLVWHTVRTPMSRGFFVNGWPHTSAVIAETASGETFVVDSWFHANGTAPEVLPLEDWVAGWSPEDGAAEQIVVTRVEPAADVNVPARMP